MEEIEDLNDDEFQYLLKHPQELKKFLELESNIALLTDEQLAAANNILQ